MHKYREKKMYAMIEKYYVIILSTEKCDSKIIKLFINVHYRYFIDCVSSYKFQWFIAKSSISIYNPYDINMIW